MSDSTRRSVFQQPGRLLLALVLAVSIFLGLAQVSVVQAASGDLEPTFDGDGKVFITWQLDLGSYVEIRSVAIQEDDKIVVAGSRFSDSSGGDLDFAVARLNQDGSLDTSFGDNGIVITPLEGQQSYSYDTANSVAIQLDGKIVVAGTMASCPFGNPGCADRIAVVRYNNNGSLDSSFSSDGIVIVSSFNNAKSVAIQNDGKIVVVGNHGSEFIALARFNSDGNLDTSFDGDGQIFTLFSGGTGVIRSVAIQAGDDDPIGAVFDGV